VLHHEDSNTCDVCTTTTSTGYGCGKGDPPYYHLPGATDQHYDSAVSLKMQLNFLMILNIVTFTNNFFCSTT
jgi:hypothetical protein